MYLHSTKLRNKVVMATIDSQSSEASISGPQLAADGEVLLNQSGGDHHKDWAWKDEELND